MSWGCGYRPVAELMFSVYNAALGTNSIPTQNKTLYKLHQQSGLSDKPGPDDRHVGRRVRMRGSSPPHTHTSSVPSTATVQTPQQALLTLTLQQGQGGKVLQCCKVRKSAVDPCRREHTQPRAWSFPACLADHTSTSHRGSWNF